MSPITDEHRKRIAVVYVRQSSLAQVRGNLESQRLQYALTDRARALGWAHVELIDTDMGISAAGGRRPGFEKLVSMVTLGQVGIILSREISRLSRNDTDFCRLMEICRVFGTLLGDDDHVYDTAGLDDQLILGIKGTLSVVELSVLKLRMQQGKEASAARGELRCRLPAGYLYDHDGHPVKDPDQRIGEVIDLAFAKFAELQNGRQLFMWFHDEHIEMPLHQYIAGRLQLKWRIPTLGYLRHLLNNPFYAGAYVYGRRPGKHVVVDGRVVRRTSKLVPAERCRVFIPDHHQPYIGWQRHQENLQILARNAPRTHANETMTAARTGAGLLVGLLRCGHCGRKLHVNYWGRSGTSPRYLCKGAYEDAGLGCISFAGKLIEAALHQQVIQALSPLGIEAAIKAIDQLDETGQQKTNVLARRAEQLQYEAQRAFDQYDQADPKNRRVTAELERRWNDKLQAAEHAQAEHASAMHQMSRLDEPTRIAIHRLGSDFEQAWNSPQCCPQTKKTLLRMIIEEIIVSREPSQLVCVVHWAGGTHTEIRLDRPTAGQHNKTNDGSIDIIRKLAPRYHDAAIAAVLNKLGHKTGQGNKWNQPRVLSARHRYQIQPAMQSAESLDLLSLQQAAKYCAVATQTIHKLITAGLITNQQTVPLAPLEIRKADLDSPKVQAVLRNLKATRRLQLGDTVTQQQSLL